MYLLCSLLIFLFFMIYKFYLCFNILCILISYVNYYFMDIIVLYYIFTSIIYIILLIITVCIFFKYRNKLK